MGEVPPHQPKICSFLPPPEKISPSRLPPLPNFYFPPHPKMQFPHYITIFKLQPNKNIIFICSHCSCTIFVLISYSLDTQDMLILILIDVKYSQKAVFSFEKGLNGQNHSTSGSHPLVKRSPHQQKVQSSQ